MKNTAWILIFILCAPIANAVIPRDLKCTMHSGPWTTEYSFSPKSPTSLMDFTLTSYQNGNVAQAIVNNRGAVKGSPTTFNGQEFLEIQLKENGMTSEFLHIPRRLLDDPSITSDIGAWLAYDYDNHGQASPIETLHPIVCGI